ncbi:DUF1365 domain-containing protein [Roseitranquillus sediminis]|uniref:DUF1365 domain-containing protein n=1 Tax=Roseitranquillus sediminis TaxID=2809051 RepID=UPI001D0CAFD3|nr:DUF1365 domain-containing protein [Roseitranquillus sediminis]MBM9593664.1 DUF1365 domain-containing protein [Roseitranquillus sediminis]
MSGVEHLAGRTRHRRHGRVSRGFDYPIDFVLLDPEADACGWRFFGLNSAALVSVQDGDHGDGSGSRWLRRLLAQRGVGDVATGRLLLLTQPRVLGRAFNPISFWFAHDAEGRLRIVVAEVDNTFGDRHAYVCHRLDLEPIASSDVMEARKVMHVSPFQPMDGTYSFRFDLRARRIAIRVSLRHAGGTLVATLAGERRPLTPLSLLVICARRGFGAPVVLALIHWQALQLWWSGARYRPRPLHGGAAALASRRVTGSVRRNAAASPTIDDATASRREEGA